MGLVTKNLPGPVAQLVTCPITDPGIVHFIPVRPHSFLEVGHKICSMVILLLPLIQEELLYVSSASMCTEY